MAIVIGGTGLVGRAIVRQLLLEGSNVVALSRDGAGLPPGVTHVGVDLTDPTWSRRLDNVPDSRSLIYCAYASSPSVERNRLVNTQGLVQAVAALDPQNVVFLSSVGVFGSYPTNGVYDEDSPRAPDTPYARDKLDAIAFLREWASTGNRRATVLHLVNVYGPDCPRTRGYADVIRQGYLVYRRDGSGFYNVVHTDDVAEAAALCLGRQDTGFKEYIVNGEVLVYNRFIALLEARTGVDGIRKLPSGLAPFLRGPLRRMISRLGYRVPIRMREPKATGCEQKVEFSAQRIKRELGWAPKRPLFETA